MSSVWKSPQEAQAALVKMLRELASTMEQRGVRRFHANTTREQFERVEVETGMREQRLGPGQTVHLHWDWNDVRPRDDGEKVVSELL